MSLIPDSTLQRPTTAWPPDASLLAYAFTDVLITALTQGCLLSYLGWYVDSPAKGSVWHRWPKGEARQLGVSVLVGVYGLWVAGQIDVVLEPGDRSDAGRGNVALAPVPGAHVELPPLETDLLAVVRSHPRLFPRDLLEHLPLPSRKRGIGARFVSGNPSHPAARGWFARTSTFASEAPLRVQQALDLAKALVVLESGSDVTESESDRRQEAMDGIENAVLDAVKRLV